MQRVQSFQRIWKHIFKTFSLVRKQNPVKLAYCTVLPIFKTANISNNLDFTEEKNKVPAKDISDEVENAVFKGGQFLMDFIPILEEIIVEISKQYRECLVKQMEMIEKSMEMEVISARVQADELKAELVRYENLVKSVAQSFYGQAAFALISGDNIQVLDILQKRLRELEDIVDSEISENRRYELKLLAVNRKVILQL